MAKVLNFYMDDSGARQPDRSPGQRASHGHDWFALGGILISEADEVRARELQKEFSETWNLEGPLHSYKIRNKKGEFAWLNKLEERRLHEFQESLNCFLRDAPVVGLACVIDRPGYNARYKQHYGDKRWMLCKTAFSVVVERAAKFAKSQNSLFRILPERCNKRDDREIEQYYQSLQSTGMPFSDNTSSSYIPFSAKNFE